MQKKIRKYYLEFVGVVLIIALGLIFAASNYASSQKSVADQVPELLMDRENYLNYSDQNLVLSEKYGRSVLFFAASDWCSTCSALDKELKQKSNLLPPDATVLKIDYDRDTQMKNKYGVVIQHTLVLLDRQGNELTRWVGGDLEEIILKLQNA